MNKGLLSKDRLKRVKWASDDLLCQVKLFLSEDCPSQVGSNGEDHLQIKASLHSNGMNIDDLPPGFGGMGNSSYTPNQICISQITWTRPRMFKLEDAWHVVAGEESEERETQNYREMRVLEALYPRVSAIPPSPSVSPEVEACDYDDNKTPLIPMSSEDEDIPIESTSCSNSVSSNESVEAKASVVDNKLHGLIAGLDANVIAASLRANEHGDMIDTDLLIKILKEPKMIEALSKVSTPLPFAISQNMNSISQPKQCTVSNTLFTSQPFHSPMSTVTSSERASDNLKPFSAFSLPYPVSELPNQSNFPSTLNNHAISSHQENGYLKRHDGTNVGKLTDHELHLSRKIVPASHSTMFGSNSSLDTSKTFAPSYRPSVMAAPVRPENHSSTIGPHISIGSSQYLSPQHDRFTSPSVRPPATKDLNYYKSLIRLHGNGAEETSQEQFMPQFSVSLPEVTQVSGQVHMRSKSQKAPCKFFNSPKGCKYGSTCPYDHVLMLDTDRSKRLKMSNDSQAKF